jgi:hypothetical protein
MSHVHVCLKDYLVLYGFMVSSYVKGDGYKKEKS